MDECKDHGLSDEAVRDAFLRAIESDDRARKRFREAEFGDLDLNSFVLDSGDNEPIVFEQATIYGLLNFSGASVRQPSSSVDVRSTPSRRLTRSSITNCDSRTRRFMAMSISSVQRSSAGLSFASRRSTGHFSLAERSSTPQPRFATLPFGPFRRFETLASDKRLSTKRPSRPLRSSRPSRFAGERSSR